MKPFMLQKWLVYGLILLMGLACGWSASAQGISGTVNNGSVWSNLPPPFGLGPIPGDGTGAGSVMVCVNSQDGTIATQTIGGGALPLGPGPFAYNFAGSFLDGNYTIVAWIDSDGTGVHDIGEPKGELAITIKLGATVIGKRVTITDDFDKDRLPDWWEAHWFEYEEDPLAFAGGDDPDGDGLSNLEEYQFSSKGYGFDFLSPADWDSDRDGMDDGWECRYFDTEVEEGMNPVAINITQDFDGDGLSNWQEYCGVDRYTRMVFDQMVGSVRKGQLNPLALVSDDLNPIDIDTDFDMLLDSFEAAWYDPHNGIDPRAGLLPGVPSLEVLIDTTIARADSDQDGLSNFREQCLLTNLNQKSSNAWLWEGQSFIFHPYAFQGKTYRICTMDSCGGTNLNLNLVMNQTLSASVNRFLLRNHGWTDPTEGTGYPYADEDIPPGHDTDDDGLPDGWEVQFGLDPRDDGFGATWDNGPFGDPDGDGLMNIDEYTGQDGNRAVFKGYVNGTGDETNPNEYHWRPDSTYQWRWINTDTPPITDASEREMGLAGAGTGVGRNETLGSALPTASLGIDNGADSDDDGIADALEISPTNSVLPSSPVDSCDPFIPRAALIKNASGIAIPDPEAEPDGPSAGWRPDLQRRDWTLECQVKLMGTNLTGNLFSFQTVRGPRLCTVYRLTLSNNVPVLVFDNTTPYKSIIVMANPLPTNRWVHLAALWSHKNNSLGLYIDGVLAMSALQLTESYSVYMQSASNRLTLAESPNGSFVNQLYLDEVRIWGLARTEKQIAEYAHKLVPRVNGDDVWIARGDFDTILVNGGSIFEREPGVPMSNVFTKTESYWIDDGDGKYDPTHDTLLVRGSNMVAGMTGSAVGEVYWNDKDHSGDFTRNALLAYYRFDDGGCSAEDFARHAKNGLLGATREEFGFGDRGYALATNSFQFVTNSVGNPYAAAKVYGVDQRGADDSDFDGLPDAWEMIHELDAWDDGRWQESAPGSKDGPNGAKGDRDGDGLRNNYEFWARNNPRAIDSDRNGVLDAQEDRDGDGVVNAIEQLLGSRPDLIDTDDDGLADSEELTLGTSPISALDPAVSRAIVLGGGSADYLEIPLNINQRFNDWTLESWTMPSNTAVGAGVIVRRVVENLVGGTQAVNYVMGLEPDGAGGLRLYAGYVLTNGKQYLVRAGAVLPSVWTHLAASFSGPAATLTIYINGVAVAATNAFNVAAPVSGRGGETFVRIGEGFGGAIDEVRLWNKVRTGFQIQANTNRAIMVTDTNGLVGDFRFDDGEANTNVFPWSEFHQPAGFQDFTYNSDWNAQWRHAAIKHGNVGIKMDGAIISPPSLRVRLQPPEVLADGAQWGLDGGAWQNSGESLQGLAPGMHMIMFKEVPGWTPPASEPINLVNGVATNLTRAYVQKSALIIRFNNLSIPSSAAWQVGVGGWLTSGMVCSNLDAGGNIVTYQPAPGYIEPPLETVVLNPGETRELLRQYNPVTANISAIIAPAGAAAAGATWSVDGGAAQVSGAIVGDLELGPHQIQFSDITRWITPANINVTSLDQVLVVVTGLYSQVTGLAVDLLPAEAVATGAQWRISGGAWTNSGTLIPVPIGTYTVEFKPVSGGWLAPGSETVVVTAQNVTQLFGIYFRAEVFGGTVTTNAGDFWLPSGLDSDSLHRLFIADTYHDRIQMYDTLSQAWTLWGQLGTALGQFKKPNGLVVDGLGNLYVADQGNHRIQKRIATNGVWVAVGSNTLISGTALGQFNAPSDVAVDSALTLYVADTWNNRVQKLSTAGVWSVFVTNGTASGRVQSPRGLHVDSSDNLYVSDDGVQTNGLNRIQKFSKTGQYLALLGGRDSGQGNLQSPAGMTIGNGHLYVADIYDSRVAFSDMSGTTWTTLLGSNVLSKPEDVEWDPRGYLYISDTSHNRILMVQVDPAAATNGLTQLTVMTSTGTNTSFTLTWFARLNWNYAVQYANTLAPSMVWSNLSGYSAVRGLDMITNCTDSTVLGITNRFYRIIAY